MGIHWTAQTTKADGKTLQTAGQHRDGNHQKQPIDTFGIAQPAAFELKQSRCLVAEQLLTTKALGVTPDQIQTGMGVPDQSPGLIQRETGRIGEQQIGFLIARVADLENHESAHGAVAGASPHSPSEQRCH